MAGTRGKRSGLDLVKRIYVCLNSKLSRLILFLYFLENFDELLRVGIHFMFTSYLMKNKIK